MYFEPFNVAQRQYVCIGVCACLLGHVRVCRECVIYTHDSTLVLVPMMTSVYFLLSIVSLFELLFVFITVLHLQDKPEWGYVQHLKSFFLLLAIILLEVLWCFKCFECLSVDYFSPLHLTISSGLPVKGVLARSAFIWYWNEMDLFAWLHRVICCVALCRKS